VASDIRRGGTDTDRRVDVYRRAFDILLSTVLLLAALPVIAVLSLGSALELRARPFFAQDRIGRGGELFRFVKVRTLRPELVARYTDKHQIDTDLIPPFCRLIRRLHLDELPQLLLVLQGRMSLVGPRPEMAYLHDRMPASFAELRTSVRPGCTGMWQISESCTELIAAAPEYDRFYLANRTLRLDLWILFRTALNMLGVGSCITLEDVPAWTLRRNAGADNVIVLPDAHVDATLTVPATAAR
jgi:lipopolysaccharide/colanic/teichoic acid biosynthesis glycosyltransferase